MPIHTDRFENPDERQDLPTSARIIQFLARHDDQAYQRQEIADAISVAPETVGTNLTRLKQRGLVRHHGRYWAFTDDRDHALEMVHDRYDDTVLTTLLDEIERSTDDGVGASSSAREPTPRQHREAATTFFEQVRTRLDDSVADLYLFGSVARNTATENSDVDVLAVISDEADYASVDDQLLDIAYDVQLESGVRIEVHSVHASEFAARKERGDPFIRTVVEEGQSSV